MDLESRIQEYILPIPPAIQGEFGRKKLYYSAKALAKAFLDLTAEQVAGYLWEFYNPRCVPPWDDSETKDFLNQCKCGWQKAHSESVGTFKAERHAQTVKAPAFPLARSRVNGSQGSEMLIPHDDKENKWKSWYEEKRDGWKCRYESWVPGVFWVPPSKKPENWKYSDIYLFDYRTGSGSPYLLTKRLELKERTADGKLKKRFVAYHWDETKHAFLRYGGDLTPIPFRLADVQKAQRVILVEGEKAAWRLNLFLKRWFDETDLITTCFPNGAGAWNDDKKKYFQDKEVLIWPDNDEAGFEYARRVAGSLRDVARGVKALTKYPSNFPPKADAVEVVDGYDSHYPYSEIKSRDLNGLIQEMFYKRGNV